MVYLSHNLKAFTNANNLCIVQSHVVKWSALAHAVGRKIMIRYQGFCFRAECGYSIDWVSALHNTFGPAEKLGEKPHL